MQIVSCTKRNTGDSADRNKGESQAFDDRQIEEWDIVVDEAGASSTWIRKHAPLPNFGSPFPDDERLRCTGEHQIRRVDGSPIHFMAVVTYETPAIANALPDPEAPENKKPERRKRDPYVYHWRTVKSQEQVDVTFTGDPIQTKTGEHFDPPVSTMVYDRQLVVGKNVKNKNQALIDAAGSTNEGLFEGYGRGQCLLDDVDIQQFVDPDTDEIYWRQTVTIAVRVPPKNNPGQILGPDLWKLRVRAEGYKVNIGTAAAPEYVTAHRTAALSQAKGRNTEIPGSPDPVLHDPETGEQIDDPKNAKFYEFQMFDTANFDALNIL